MNRLFPLARTRSTSNIDAKSMARAGCLAWAALFVVASLNAASAQTKSDSKIDFNTQIRPILSNRCFACHGPDEQTVESGLRLDSFEAATSAADSGKKAIAPGSPGDSEILHRILSSDDQVRMPPPRFAERLTDKALKSLGERGSYPLVKASIQVQWLGLIPSEATLPPSDNAAQSQ
jgi:mono/diheme cytochrome c family protein